MGILEFKNVSKGYGETPVLRNLSLDIREGEFLAILGFSGSGKTTLINLMAGLTLPDNGEIRFHGKPVTGPGPERGLVFQSYALMPWLTVAGNIALAVDAVSTAPKPDRAALVQKYIKMVGLSHAADRRPAELSGGMRQRVTTREIAADGFTTKNRDWNAVEVLEGWREAWAQDANLALELAGHGERIDHRTLEAQRIEALELSSAAEVRGDEVEALHQTVRAVALDRPPLPQLSAGAWQLKERGQEVAAVRVWHEVKAHAAEVARVAQELACQVRSWLERAADHVLDRMQPTEPGLAYEGGGQDRDRPQDLAARMREAWALRDQRSDIGDKRSAISDEISDKPDAPQTLADRLRAASKGLDHDEIAARLAAIRQSREVEKEHVAQEAESLHDKELEQEREAKVRRERMPGHEL